MRLPGTATGPGLQRLFILEESIGKAWVLSARFAGSPISAIKRETAIISPIDGVVLQRNIEPGNAVAANFQTPQLFLLAEALRQMELHVSLDEADVALVTAGQTANFTVDA